MNSQNFAREWERLRPGLLYHVRRFFDEETAETIVGDVLLSALRALPHLPEDGENGFSLRSWLNLLTKYRRLQQSERRKRRQGKMERVSLTLEHDGGEYERPELSAQAEQMHAEERDAAEAKYRVRKLLRLAPLSLAEKRLLAYLMDGGNVADYARASGVSRQAAHQHYQSAKEKLRAAQVESQPDTAADWTGDTLLPLVSGVTIYARPNRASKYFDVSSR